jgi:single-strand DNA-binding protein
MPSYNQVLLMGNVTRDPQLKQLPSGSAVADFGLATNRKYRTAAGEDKEETCFVDCAAFGKQAEVIHQYCQKGKPLFIEGRLKHDTWEDAKSGAKRRKLSVIVENFQFLGGKDGGGSFRGAAAESGWRDDDASKKPRHHSAEKQFDGPPKFSQADIPF